MTVSSGINNLQYIKVGNSYSAAENAVGQELIGTIDDIKFYNGVTSATQDEKATLIDTYGWQDFDGSADYITIPTSPLGSIGGSDDFSIAFWVKTDDFAGGGAPALLGCYGADSEGGFQLYENGGALKLTNSTTTLTSSITGIEDSAWHHIAVTRSGSTLTFYKNGSSSSTHSYGSESLPAPDTYMQIARRGDNAQYCDMQLQDLGFWSRALSSADVAVLAGGVPIDKATLATAYTTDLEGYYKFNGDYNDSKSGSSNHGVGTSTADPNTTSDGKFNKVSDLPENTLFEETDTRFVYFLQSNVWENSKQPLNMTFADQTAADLVWNPDTTNTIRIDVSNKYLFDSFDSTTGTFTMTQNTYDLGSNLDTTWTVQFTLRASNFRSPTSSNYTWFFGMWSLDSDSNANTTQDRLLIVYDTTNHFQSSGANAAGDGSLTTMPTTNPTLSSSTNSTEYFVTLQKTGTTGYKVVLRTGSHSGTILSTHSPTWQAGTPSTFRYFGMKTRMANSSRLGAIIKDVTVYDGALVG
jgi:hypothetical protein